MGIYDRDYYRNEGPSFLDSLLPQGRVCKWLIGINLLVFVLQLLTYPVQHHGGMLDFGLPIAPNARQVAEDDGPNVQAPVAPPEEPVFNVTTAFDLEPEKVVYSGQVWRLLTYAFLHSPNGFYGHIFFNMLFLWWFGSDVEQLYGEREFLFFYLTAACIGGVAYTIWALIRGPILGTDIIPSCIGASGAVTALLVLCAMHYPRRTVPLFTLLPIPIWMFAVFSVAKDAFMLLSGIPTQTAVVVHLAGAGFAFAYYRYQRSLGDVYTGFADLFRRHKLARSGARLKVYRPEAAAPANPRPEPVPVSAPAPSASIDEHFEAKLDAVLDKIKQSGKESLTDGERDILLRASELYKKKRT
jgi:membrane associated rhomboid family serine protease